MTSAVTGSRMPLLLSSVSHYMRNAVFNMVFVENVYKEISVKKKKKKQKQQNDLITNCEGTTQDYRK